MLETQIKNALKKAGLPEGWAKRIKVEKEEDIEAAVNTLKTEFDKLQKLSGDELIQAIRDSGLEEPFKKHLQTEGDRRANQAVKTHEDKIRTKLLQEFGVNDPNQSGGQNGTQSGGNNQNLKTDEMPTWAKALIDSFTGTLKPIQETVNKLIEDGKTKNKGELILKALKEAGLDPKYEKYITADDEKGINEQVAAVKQDFIDHKAENGHRPGQGKGGEKGDTVAELVAEEKNKGSTDGDFLGMESNSKGAKS